MLCSTLMLLTGLLTFHPMPGEFNNDNDLIGVQCDNASIVYMPNNSYNEETWVISYSQPLLQSRSHAVGLSVSLATGYSHLVDANVLVIPMLSAYVDLGVFRVIVLPSNKGGVGAVSIMARIKL